jgi:predicted PurR-regulated permease PerM
LSDSDKEIVPGRVEVAGSPEEPALHAEIEINRLRLPSVVLATVGVLAVLFLSYIVYKTLVLLLVLFLALLIATAIEPVVNFLRRGPFNRSAGILVVYTGIFLVLGAIGWLTLPIVFEQIGELGTSLNKTVGEMRKGVSDLDSAFLRQQATLFLDVAENFAGQVVSSPADSSAEEKVETVTQATITVAEIFFALVTIFVVAFYWLTERTLIKRAVMSWFPAKRANRIRRVWDDIEVKVGGWVRGQFTLMATVGAVSAVGYFVLGIKYWPALALFIAIAEAIPLVGPYIGTAPAVLVALTQTGNDGLPALLGMGDFGSVTRALLVVAFALLLQTIEGNVLVPRVMKDTVGVTPLTVIISILFGATLAGLAGALVAVPLAGSLQVIIQDLKAARDSEAEFIEKTEAAHETRAVEGELVVAYPSPGETKTQVEGKAKA